jgi:glycosyltransferase involved in cell wall biosynthesis
MVHIITGLATGGAERALYNLLIGGLKEKFNIAVVSLGDEGTYGPRIQELGLPVIALGIQRAINWPTAFTRLRSIINHFAPDIIQGWMYHGNLAASIASWLANGHPSVTWNIRHSLYSLGLEKPLTRQIIKTNRLLSNKADMIIYNSRLSRNQHEAMGFEGKSARMIPNGFDVMSLRPDPDIRKVIRSSMSIPEESIVIGHVARFHPMKDHVSFLRAAVQLAKKLPVVRFLLVGRKVTLGNQKIAGLVPPNMLDRFYFLGERADVPSLMQAMDVLCSSSAWGEAFPNVLGEAMASGVPCVATDVGDSSHIVDNTGIIVQPSNSEELENGLLTMLLMTKDERVAMAKAARARIESVFALPGIVDQYAKYYYALVKKKQ